MVKIESKEKLAKLLAMEDIDIQHRSVRTAMFDVKNRVLTLPVWKDMPNHLYDLLVGHEVGHALFTPNDEEKLTKLIKKSSKHCVNVVEDARIEALMKRKYPGLRKQFYKGYSHLVEKDFFGLSKMDITKINLLDKINLTFKIPQAVQGLIEFNEQEQSFIDRIEKLTKFSELEKLCVEICDYIKENREEDDDENSIFDEDSHTFVVDENEDDMGEEMEQPESGDSEEDAEESEESETESKSGEGEEDEDETEASDEENEDGEADEQATSNGSPDYDEADDEDLQSQTYKNFEENVKEKYNEREDVDNVYATIPESINYDNIIDYKDCYKALDEYYSLEGYMNSKQSDVQEERYRYSWYFNNEVTFQEQCKDIFDRAKKTLDKIKKESVKNVNHMAMEFERKKCADIYRRTLLTKTGVLDTNKLFSAKYNDDVFRKNVRVPDGKNHGLVMFVDWSGSMAQNLGGCVKQLIELVLFCKKVNIPFEVYSFTDINAGHGDKKTTFNYKHGDLMVDTKVTLKNYLSSRMNAKELQQAMLKLVVISNSFFNGYRNYPIPEEDQLGYTPLNGAILASEHLIKNFKRAYNLQEVHAVFITDGEGNQTYSVYNSLTGKGDGVSYTKQLHVQDTKTKKNYKIGRRYMTPVCFEILKNRVGCNVIGFFLDNNFGKKYSMQGHFWKSGFGQDVKFSEWNAQAKKDGFFVRKEGGYDEYYVISSAPKVIKTSEITDKMTARKMASVFGAQTNKFKKSRVILSRFIDLITKKL